MLELAKAGYKAVAIKGGLMALQQAGAKLTSGK